MTNTTSSSCLPKKTTTSASYLQSPITPNVFGKQSTNSYTANPSHRYSSLLMALHMRTFLLSQATYPNSVSPSPATPLHHICTHPYLLLPLPLTSQFSLTSTLSTSPPLPASFIPLSRNPRLQTAGLAFGGLCSYRVRGVDGSYAKHLTVESYTVIYAANSHTYYY